MPYMIVLQTECYGHGTFTGWYMDELRETEWEDRAMAALKMTCRNARSHSPMGRLAAERKLGFLDPRYADQVHDWKVKGGQTPASDLQKQIAREIAKKKMLKSGNASRLEPE